MRGYTLLVYKKDRRCRGGERFWRSFAYPHSSGHSMMEEVKELYNLGIYPRHKYRLDFCVRTQPDLDTAAN